MINSVLPNNINPDSLKDIPFFFVIGRPRSGTTLLRTLLDAHTNVIIPFESPLVLKLANKFSGINNWTEKEIGEFYESMVVLKKFDTWLLDKELLKLNLEKIDSNMDYQTIIKFVYSHFNPVFDKEEIKIFGDKNPHYASSINKIFALFPNAKYLHITRDYRDNILSNLKFEFGSSKKSLLAYRWKESILKLAKLKIKYPDQFFTLRYEDLVDKPSELMESICSFLEIEYQPDVVNFHEKKDQVLSNFPEDKLDEVLKFQENLIRPINKSAVGKWKTDLSENDIRLADLVVGRIAEEYGYKRKFKNFNIIFFLKSFPLITVYRISQAIRYLYNKYLR